MSTSEITVETVEVHIPVVRRTGPADGYKPVFRVRTVENLSSFDPGLHYVRVYAQRIAVQHY
jgi:hypothetical protein